MPHPFDVVIRGGTVMDGNGGTPFTADVAVKDGKIAEVGKVSASGAEEHAQGHQVRSVQERLDADGLPRPHGGLCRQPFP